MEKSTKKQPGATYGRVSKEGVEKLFGSKVANNTPKPESTPSDTVTQDHGGVAEAERLGGVFSLIDPIPTIVGPIGRFPAVPEAFPLHPAIVAFGKRRTGKTFTTRDIFYHCFQNIPFGIVLTRTKMNGFWQKYVPPAFVFDGLQPHILHRLLARQESLIAKWKKDHPKETEKNPDSYKEAPELAAFVIMDDCVSDQHMVRYNTELTALFVEGRHSCLTVVFLTQYPKGIGPILRGNADVAIFQPIFQRDAREVLADLYGGWMERKVFYQLMDEIVKDVNLPGSTPQEPKKEVRTMFVSDYENTLNPQIKFHYYESVDPGDFKLCDPEYWKETHQMFAQSKQHEEIDVVEELESVMWN